MSDTLHKKLEEISAQFPDEIAMQMKKGKCYITNTYKEFYNISCSTAYFLVALGIEKGDRVAIVLENRPEWGMIYFAILFAGGIAVPIDHQSSQEEIRFILSDSKSKVVFTSSTHLSLFEASTSLQKVVVLDPVCAEASAGRHESCFLHQDFTKRVSKKCIDFSNVSSFLESAKKELLPNIRQKNFKNKG